MIPGVIFGPKAKIGTILVEVIKIKLHTPNIKGLCLLVSDKKNLNVLPIGVDVEKTDLSI